MWKPNESLDDYLVDPAPETIPEPPRAVSLRHTGEVEVVKPLTLAQIRANRRSAAFRPFPRSGGHQPLWFRRFVMVGSGALVVIGLVLISAILVGLNDPVAEPDVAANVTPDDELTQHEEPLSFEGFSPSTFAPSTGRVDIVRSHPRRRSIQAKIQLTAIRSRRRPTLAPRPELPKFAPTTLVIYAENGVINTRIEPWLQASNKKTPAFEN